MEELCLGVVMRKIVNVKSQNFTLLFIISHSNVRAIIPF